MRNIQLFCCFLVLLYSTKGDGKLYRSDYQYDPAAEGWFKVHSIPATWHDARIRCSYEGAVLATPLTKGILNATKRVFEDLYFGSPLMHTGIHSTFSEGDYTSIEGVPLAKLPIVPTNIDVSKGCLTIDGNLALAVSNCHQYLPYMCFKKDTGKTKLSVCGPEEFGYHFVESTGSCYKVHTTGRTWSRGHSTCLAEEGHLAIINSESEAEVLKELLAKYPADTILADYNHVASIGFLDWGERGSWWTVQGETLEQAGFSTWENGGPDSKTQFCGGFNRSGKLNDIWCHNQTFPVICERPPLRLNGSFQLPNNEQ